jgi:hypothetical protein
MDLQKTQHYTTQSEEICQNLTKYIPTEAKLIEPFAGQGDLIGLFSNNEWEQYDIDPKEDWIIGQDTLLNPPNYSGKWVITNPPYLAKNKTSDFKEIFNKYGVDDLYKAALLSILDAEGGILIIPMNFFTDERTGMVRTKFLDTFEILEINFFSQPVFKSTTYSVCSFAFKRKQTQTFEQIIPATIYPQQTHQTLKISKKYDYRVAGEFYHTLSKEKVVFGRLTDKIPQNKFLTNIKLFALDTHSEKIRLEYCEIPFYGKPTDRTYATFISDIKLDEETQKTLIAKFNEELNSFREQFGNLSLTNYRDFNRKRIGFTMAYKLASKILKEIKDA